jgi:hypothetical protein
MQIILAPTDVSTTRASPGAVFVFGQMRLHMAMAGGIGSGAVSRTLSAAPGGNVVGHGELVMTKQDCKTRRTLNV